MDFTRDGTNNHIIRSIITRSIIRITATILRLDLETVTMR